MNGGNPAPGAAAQTILSLIPTRLWKTAEDQRFS
jgi:hypothetical protein